MYLRLTTVTVWRCKCDNLCSKDDRHHLPYTKYIDERDMLSIEHRVCVYSLFDVSLQSRHAFNNYTCGLCNVYGNWKPQSAASHPSVSSWH